MRTVKIHWEISHHKTPEGIGLQVWQYVDGRNDGGFSCLAKDYQFTVATKCGIGALALALNNEIFYYLKDNKLINL